jgi:hypothetical protein
LGLTEIRGLTEFGGLTEIGADRIRVLNLHFWQFWQFWQFLTGSSRFATCSQQRFSVKHILSLSKAAPEVHPCPKQPTEACSCDETAPALFPRHDECIFGGSFIAESITYT